METITKRIREEIYNELIDNHCLCLENLSENFNMNLLVLMFDYYNHLYFRQKVGDVNNYDLKFIFELMTTSFEDLFNTFISQDYYVSKSLESNYFFNSLTTIEKQNFMYELHFNNEKNVITVNSLYMFDMLGYVPSNKLEDIVKYCSEYFAEVFPNFDGGIDEVLFNLEVIKELQYDSYKEIVLEIFHDFYKLDKFRLSQEKHLEIKNRIYHFLIKHLSDDNIIKFSTKNKKMFYEIVDLYLANRVFITDEYYRLAISESESKMSKKLLKKFNNNKKEN